jgi:hypothetical protein
MIIFSNQSIVVAVLLFTGYIFAPAGSVTVIIKSQVKLLPKFDQ